MLGKVPRENHIPTIEEMEECYKEDLRVKALNSLEDENDKKVEEQGEFFRTFRRLDKRKMESISETRKNNFYYERYVAYIEKETVEKGREIEEIKNLIEYQRFFLNWERRVNREVNNSRHYGSNSATRYRVDAIKRLEEELERNLKESKEAWELYYKQQLIKDIEDKKRQCLVNVPYVLEAKGKVIDSLNLGVPVYIVGHLGSGKTQLATEAALDFTIESRIQRELEEKMNDWFSLNPNVAEKDALKKFKEFNEERKQYYKDILINGSKEEIEALQPLFISGSHNLTYEDMFVEKTLSLNHSFSQGSFVDYLNMIIEDFYDWMDNHKERLDEMTNEEQLQLKIQIWKSFSDLLVASNSAFGTEIKKIEREILTAVKEGRPVIVDELNTIAMQNLIGLNDILQRHAGSTAYITGVGPVMIKPGFGFIGTGNLSTEMVNYEGTNELNPAFKSRFVTIEYNYVPQSITGSLEDQELREKNQLFRVILTGLADQNGNIHIPDSKRTLEELFRFSQLCRVTQNVFMGKWKDNGLESDSSREELELREAVLSVRNILHIMDNWNQGEDKDLSKALWDGFISSITYADDQNYILSQAVRFGFFPASQGWNVETKAMGEGTTIYEEIRTRPYKYIRPEIETLSYLDMVHLIFGKGPERKKIPEELMKVFQANMEDVSKIHSKKYQELDQGLYHLDHSKKLLEYLEENEGRNMKPKLSVNGEDYKTRIKALRKMLNECKETGNLDDDFEKELERLSQIEEELLKDLIPYYRLYGNKTKETSMKIMPIEELGNCSFNGFPKNILRINENLFIVNGLNGKVKFFYIDFPIDSSKGKIQVEWSKDIKGIKERISIIYKLNHGNILLLGVGGGAYILSIDDSNKLPNVDEEIMIEEISHNCHFKEFRNVLDVRNNTFVVVDEKDKLNIVEVTEKDNKYSLVHHRDASCTILDWATMEKIEDDFFVVGTKYGIIYFIKYENEEFNFIGEVDVFRGRIRKIRLLEYENADKKSIMVAGNKGNFKIITLLEDKIIEGDNLKGNLFDIESKDGTAVVLSEDGLIYLFEENFNIWDLNEDVTIENMFFTTVFKITSSNYLLMDIGGKLNILDIDRIRTPEDLWNMPLYQ